MYIDWIQLVQILLLFHLKFVLSSGIRTSRDQSSLSTKKNQEIYQKICHRGPAGLSVRTGGSGRRQ